MSDDTESKLFTWGVKGASNYQETNPGDVPAPSLFALALRGYRHVLGNEVAAQRSAYIKTEEGKALSVAELDAWEAAKRAEKLAKIMEGTLGVRTAGAPRVTGVDAIQRAVTLESLKALLKKYNLKMPTGDNTIEIAGKTHNRESLIEAEYRRSKAAIDAEVERQVAYKASVEEGADLAAFGEVETV